MRSIFARDVWLACTESPLDYTQKNDWWIANNPRKENHPSMHGPNRSSVKKAHRQEALWNKSLWFRMCRKLKWQLNGDRLQQLNVCYVAMCAIVVLSYHPYKHLWHLSLHLGGLFMGCMGWMGCMLQMWWPDQTSVVKQLLKFVAEGLMRVASHASGTFGIFVYLFFV